MAKIAVIGSGISGLAAAWILSQEHEVTVYEKNDYVGGHTNTRVATFENKNFTADTGFMVFNKETYPNMLRMFEFLNIPYIETDMSFGIASSRGEFEFSSDQIFAGWKSVCNPKRWQMILDIIRFNRTVEKCAAELTEDIPLAQLLEKMNLGKEFQQKYLLPMSGAIWSTEKNRILEYPAKRFVSFYSNHGLLSPKSFKKSERKKDRLQWYTVKNGAKEYVNALLAQSRFTVEKSNKIEFVRKTQGGLQIGSDSEMYDHVVCAGHPDEMAILLPDSIKAKKSLAAFAYTKSHMVMHKDTSNLMKLVKRLPSWMYIEEGDRVEISYYMNRLQNIDEKFPVIVSLNPNKNIKKEDIFYETTYHHPLYSLKTSAIQKEIRALQGEDSIWYAGAWLGYGFHEDGLKSAIEIGKAFNLTPPWEK